MSTLEAGLIIAVLVAAGGCAKEPPRPAEVPVPSIDAPSKPRPQLTTELEAPEPLGISTTPSTTLDSDKDGIIDAQDACPNEPGTAHSNPAKNGCPYIGPYVPTEIRILTTITFSNGDAGIANENNVLLAEVAKALLEHPEFTRVRMTGHAARGEKNAMLLSEIRAKAVLKALTTAGVDVARLVAVGKGDTQPIENNDTTEGRAKNRRVEFQILEPLESSR